MEGRRRDGTEPSGGGGEMANEGSDIKATAWSQLVAGLEALLASLPPRPESEEEDNSEEEDWGMDSSEQVSALSLAGKALVIEDSEGEEEEEEEEEGEGGGGEQKEAEAKPAKTKEDDDEEEDAQPDPWNAELEKQEGRLAEAQVDGDKVPTPCHLPPEL